MNKKILFLMLTLMITAGSNAQNKNEGPAVIQKIREAASSQALSFLNLIPEGKEKDYGFSSRSEFSAIKIEEPYQTYYISNHDNQLVFLPGNEWRVPLSVDGNFVALLTVQVASGQASVVDFGGNLLAEKLQEFEKLYPPQTGQRVILRNTFLTRDYATTDFPALGKDQEGMKPIAVNTYPSQKIYQLHGGLPLETSLADLRSETLNLIKNTSNK